MCRDSDLKSTPDSRTEVIFVATQAWGGGAEKIAHLLACLLSENGFRVSLCSTTPHPKAEDGSNIRYVTLYPKMAGKISSKLFAVFRLHREIVCGATVVSVTQGLPFLFILLASLLKRVNVVLWLHCDPLEYVKHIGTIKKFVLWLSIFFAKRAVVPSLTAMKSLRECSIWSDKKPIYCLRNGIVTDKMKEFSFAGVQSESTIKLFGVGSLAPLKRWEFLIQAGYELKKMGFNISIEIFGEGRSRGKLTELIKKLGMEGEVVLRGFVSQPFGEVPGILVHPSETESSPLAVIEALAYGFPVVSFPIPAILEMSHLDGALFIAKENTLDALVQAILKVYCLPEASLREMRQRSRFWAYDSYGEKFMLDNFCHIVRRVSMEARS